MSTWRDMVIERPATYTVDSLECPQCKSVSDAKKCSKCKMERVPVKVEADWSTRAEHCRTWEETHTKAGRAPMDRETLERVEKCADSLRNNAGIFSQALRSPSKKTEVSHFKLDAETGLLLKCRTDLEVNSRDGDYIVFDLKKVQVGCGSEVEFAKSVKNFGYHIQAAFYMDVTGATQFFFVPFDDNEPFACAVWPLNPEWLRLGRLEYRRILRDYARCFKSGTWPGYPQADKFLPMPDYLKKRITELESSPAHVLSAAVGGTQ